MEAKMLLIKWLISHINRRWHGLPHWAWQGVGRDLEPSQAVWTCPQSISAHRAKCERGERALWGAIGTLCESVFHGHYQNLILSPDWARAVATGELRSGNSRDQPGDSSVKSYRGVGKLICSPQRLWLVTLTDERSFTVKSTGMMNVINLSVT